MRTIRQAPISLVLHHHKLADSLANSYQGQLHDEQRGAWKKIESEIDEEPISVEESRRGASSAVTLSAPGASSISAHLSRVGVSRGRVAAPVGSNDHFLIPNPEIFLHIYETPSGFGSYSIETF